ncbi:MAG: ABC transporter permease subunit [Verrucomicrobiota bacterium]
MRVFLILLVKELRGFFLSPIAWVVMGLVMILNGFSFSSAMTDLENNLRSVTMAAYTFNSQHFWLAYFFVFPVITMRLFAEEQKLGTIETLLTAPVNSWQVILAKYFAALVFYIIIWVPSLLNFVIFRLTCLTDGTVLGSLTGSYLVIILLGVFNIAIGCLASSVTANQIVAAMICFTLCLLHFLIGYLLLFFKRDVPPQYQDFVSYISTVEHVRLFIDGLVNTKPFIYYISFAALILFLTHHILEYRKWKV